MTRSSGPAASSPSPARQRRSRAQLRRHFRRLRRGLCPATRRRHAEAVARRVATSGLLFSQWRFALYWAMDGEMETAGLIERLLACGKELALPVLDRQRRLHFCRYGRESGLRPNRYGIPEPDMGGARPWPLASIDVVFMPLVAFDRQGLRLGMGGGYYDRTFEHLCGGRRGSGRAAPRSWRRPLLIGLAHALQESERLPANAWDVPMDAVVTERGYTAFTRRAARYGE